VTSPASASPTPAPSAGTWRTLAPMPTPRTEVAVAALDGLIYVVGGFEADGSVSAKVEVYDPISDTWDGVAPLPAPRHHAAAVAFIGRVFVIGGFATSFSDPRADVWSYDSASKRWSNGPHLTVARGAHAAAADPGNVVVFGGVGSGMISVASIEIMDWLTQVLNVSPHLFPLPRDHLAIAAQEWSAGGDVFEILMYVIGGRLRLDYGLNVDRIESFHEDGALNVRHSPMPTARSGIAAAALGGRIYVFGGESPAGTFDENERYDPETDSWETMAPMPTARHGLGAAVVGGTVYVIGGGPEPGLSVSGANEAYTP